MPRVVGEGREREPQTFVAGPAEHDGAVLTRLVRHGGDARLGGELLGSALVERARTRVSPTECGVRVLVHAREMLAREEHIRQQAKLSHGVQTGHVRLGSAPSVSSRLLPGLVGSLARRHPSLEVVLFEGTDEEVVEWLHARAIDVGVVTVLCKAFDTADMISDDMLVIIPAAHRLRAAAQGPPPRRRLGALHHVEGRLRALDPPGVPCRSISPSASVTRFA